MKSLKSASNTETLHDGVEYTYFQESGKFHSTSGYARIWKDTSNNSIIDGEYFLHGIYYSTFEEYRKALLGNNLNII